MFSLGKLQDDRINKKAADKTISSFATLIWRVFDGLFFRVDAELIDPLIILPFVGTPRTDLGLFHLR